MSCILAFSNCLKVAKLQEAEEAAEEEEKEEEEQEFQERLNPINLFFGSLFSV